MVKTSNEDDTEIYVINDKFSKDWSVSYSVSGDSYVSIIIDSATQEWRDMHGDYFEVAQTIKGNVDQIRAFRQIIAEGKSEIIAEGIVLSISDKRQMIENFYGSQAHSEIDVHPPDVVKTKGSGRRPLTRLEQAMKMKAKPGRKCAECGEVGNHDARNCKKIKEKQKIK
ncbi:hypothetical protein SASPL_157447 [Salvia splendens]|uniref:Protein FAR1-RELATED SEQUENCE n=2 Tax=Salvia splendens TaxID=180675 RepID=A0A8X8VUV1_SALSN|nr:hypothetical protein SASPL_157447 [Salvia splendens]